MKNLSSIFVLLIVTILISSSTNVKAQWVQTNGPEGGNFYKILFNGGDLLAFSRYDLFVSTNNGISWNWRSSFPEGGGNLFLNESDIYLLGTGGVQFSSDNGITWTDRNNGLDSLYSSFSMTRLGNLLFVGGQGQTWTSCCGYDYYGALFKSSDNGESWQKVIVPFVPNDLNIVSFCTVDTILIALGQKAIYRSINKGSSWQMVLNSAPHFSPSISRAPIFSIDSIIILGGDNSIFRSSDYGASWHVVVDTTGASSFMLYNGTLLAATGNQNQTLLRSSDLGNSWYSLPFYHDSDIRINELYQSNGYIFGMDLFNGLFRSNDEGISWENVSKDFPVPSNYRSITFKDSLLLLSNLFSGIFRSTDYGTTWQGANNGLTNMPIYHLQADDNFLLASTAYPSSSNGELYQSSDNGNTWNLTTSDVPNFKKCFLRFKDKYFAGTQWGGIVVSTDEGKTWTKSGLPEGFINSLIEINDSIYAGSSGTTTGESEGLFLSADGGTSWDLVANPSLPAPIYVRDIIKVKEPNEMKTLIFINTSSGIYRSSNGGNNWLASSNGIISPSSIWTIAATYTSINSGVNLFAATKDHFYISTNLGDSWNPLDNIDYQSSLKLYSYPENSGLDSILFALTDTKIFMSSDQGQNWTSLWNNLEDVKVYDLSINSNYIYLGTSRGVWKRPLSEMITSVEGDKTSIPTQFKLNQNFPNPFNPSTTIKFDIAEQSEVSLKIYDILGEEVATLKNEILTPGRYTVEWDASKYASGIYFCQIKAESFLQTKKMILLK